MEWLPWFPWQVPSVPFIHTVWITSRTEHVSRSRPLVSFVRFALQAVIKVSLALEIVFPFQFFLCEGSQVADFLQISPNQRETVRRSFRLEMLKNILIYAEHNSLW